MAQLTKYIDLSRTYLPIDPLSLPETMHATQGEDSPEGRLPVVPYEGWNFMPTAYGWRSYFGITSTLQGGVLATPAKCRDVFVFQKNTLANVLIALCDDGIWTRSGDSGDNWNHDIVLADPADGTTHEWSYCTIENVLYIYRQAEASVWEYSAANLYVMTAHVPTTLNMSGQLGIFKAGGRLGFWDSSNSIAHSSYDDKYNVTPAVSTGANITTLVPLLGKIINIKQHGDGFIVYASKSIIAVRKDLTQIFGWNASAILAAGIAYRNQVTVANPDTIHYAWTSAGLVNINNFQEAVMATEFYDYLIESNDPIYLKLLEGRYLFVQVADSKYVDGRVLFYTNTIPAETITLQAADTLFSTFPNRAVTASWIDTEQSDGIWSFFNASPGNASVAADGGEIKDCGGVTNYGKDYRSRYWLPINVNDPRVLSGNVDISVLAWNAKSSTVNGVTVLTKSDVRPELTNPIDNYMVIDDDKNFYTNCTAIFERYETFMARWYTEYERRLAKLGVRAVGANTGINTATDLTAQKLPLILSGAAGTMKTQIWPVTGKLSGATLPANPLLYDFYAPIIYSNYWLSYDKYQDMYFVNAHAKRLTTVQITPDNNYINYNGPYTVTLSGWTGSFTSVGTAYNIGVINSATLFGNWLTGMLAAAAAPYTAIAVFVNGVATVTAANLNNLLTFMHIKTNYSAGFPTFNCALTGIAGFKYVNKAGIQVGVNANYSDKTTSTFHDGTPTDFTFDTQITCTGGLSSDDKVTYTKTVQDFTKCDIGSLVPSWSYPQSYFRYDSNCKKIASPANPPAIVYLPASLPTYQGGQIPSNAFLHDTCLVGAEVARNEPRMFGMSFTPPSTRYTITFSTGDVASGQLGLDIPEITVTYPDATFLMQQGAPTPYDITWLGAYVLDTQLKRWGKMKASYRQLLDFSPVNSTAINTVPYTQFGVEGALLNSAGNICLFDTLPTDSKLKFGKWGLSRQGYTDLEQVRVDFRSECTGVLTTEASLDGVSVEVGLIKTYDYTDATQLRQGIGSSGRWHNFQLSGQFDLVYLEATGFKSSRR